MFKFLHAADIHLDSPLKGLDRYENAPVDRIRNATRRAFEGLVRLALTERVDFVLLAGDLYDGDWPDYNTGLFLNQQVAVLHEAGIPVFVIAGNHDAANRMTRSLRLPENVRYLSAESPETVVLEDLGVAVHGQSFATMAVYEDLSRAYPAALPHYFNIGLLHTCATGRDGHDRYAPCSVESLCAKGYDYWALGHIHQREVLSRQPLVVFPGNVQGRHIREAGAKGCLLVSVADRQRVEMDFRPLDVVRWELAEIDVREAHSTDEVLELVGARYRELEGTEARLTAVRVVLTGPTSAHQSLLSDTARWTSELRSPVLLGNNSHLWLEKVLFRTSEPASEGELEGVLDGPLGELNGLFDELGLEPGLLEQLDHGLDEVFHKLPPELRDCFPWQDASLRQGVLAESRAWLLGQLRVKEG